MKFSKGTLSSNWTKLKAQTAKPQQKKTPTNAAAKKNTNKPSISKVKDDSEQQQNKKNPSKKVVKKHKTTKKTDDNTSFVSTKTIPTSKETPESALAETVVDPDSIQHEIESSKRIIQEMMKNFNHQFDMAEEMPEYGNISNGNKRKATTTTTEGVASELDTALHIQKTTNINKNDVDCNDDNEDDDDFTLSPILLAFKSLDKNQKDSNKNKQKIGKYIAIDCEMVGTGPKGQKSMLARVSIVNYFGHVVYDSYVAATDQVTDYRTEFSGITKEMLIGAPSCESVQQKVKEILTNKVIIGHSIKFDLQVLDVKHPFKLIRDTAQYLPYKELYKTQLMSTGKKYMIGGKVKSPPLKFLAKKVLSVDVQSCALGHSSIEDARISMLLYRNAPNWEQEAKSGRLFGKEPLQ